MSETDIELGDAVIDSQQEDEQSVAFVIDLPTNDDGEPIRAFSYEIVELGTTVEAVNDPKYENDPVAVVVYRNGLDAFVPDWRDWSVDEFRERLADYKREYTLPTPGEYAYPVTRLEKVDEPGLADR